LLRRVERMSETVNMTESLPPVPTHTEEAREMLAAGVIRPGDKALDVPPESMTMDELLREILIHERNTRDAVNQLVAAIMSSPMASMLGGSKLSEMLGG
jgi:hypothetical protein